MDALDTDLPGRRSGGLPTPTALELELWRGLARPQPLAASLAAVLALLQATLPLRWLRLTRYAGGVLQSCAEWTAAQGWQQRPRTLSNAGAVCRDLEAWALHQSQAAVDPQHGWPRPFSALNGLTETPATRVLALRREHRLCGLLLLELAPGAVIDEALVALLDRVGDALAVALQHDSSSHPAERRPPTRDSGTISAAGRQPAGQEVIGADCGLRQVMARVEQVAPSRASVLILGETGSGKEVIARAIHERSPRREQAFVRVNCGAVSPELIDSELFGHEKGSFTGAIGVRRGWFERADGGTLFLDEIGELTPAVQIRLLRVLQDGIVQRVGSEHDIAVDVRVIAATHRDLPVMVQEGRFREDLWYRLAVFPIILPPLHERPEDIPLLAEHFARRAAHRLGTPAVALRAHDVDLLLRYRWPGNVRELAAVLERAVILGQGQTLELEVALGAAAVPTAAEAAARAEQPGQRTTAASGALATLEQAMALHIEHALRETAGRIEGPGGAACLLDVNASTLRAKLRKLRIDPQRFRSDR